MKKSPIPTLLGFLALLFWSTSIAFTRTVTEHMGTLNAAFFNLLFSGLILLTFQLALAPRKTLNHIRNLPLSYFLRVGIFMVVYMVFFCLAIGEAASREAVIVAGIFNYLWPGFIFLFSVPLLKQKTHYPWLILGILVAFSGTAAALLESNRVSVSQLSSTLSANIIPYSLAFTAAVAWGLYSNLARKHKTQSDIVSVPLLFLVSAAVILVVILLKGQTPRLLLSGWQYAEFAYLVLFPTALAYLAWNRAMASGNKHLITMFSYAVPLISTLITGLYLGVKIGPGFWGGSILVLAGAAICRKAVSQ